MRTASAVWSRISACSARTRSRSAATSKYSSGCESAKQCCSSSVLKYHMPRRDESGTKVWSVCSANGRPRARAAAPPSASAEAAGAAGAAGAAAPSSVSAAGGGRPRRSARSASCSSMSWRIETRREARETTTPRQSSHPASMIWQRFSSWAASASACDVSRRVDSFHTWLTSATALPTAGPRRPAIWSGVTPVSSHTPARSAAHTAVSSIRRSARTRPTATAWRSRSSRSLPSEPIVERLWYAISRASCSFSCSSSLMYSSVLQRSASV